MEGVEGQQSIEIDSWVSSMPKVELHAHLNGSIRKSTLVELARATGENDTIDFADETAMKEVFKMFDLIHNLTADHTTVTRITKEVIEDFAAENVVYIELRTTPKKNDSIGMSKRSYMEAVVKGLRTVTAVDVAFAPTKLETGNTVNMNPPNVSNTCSGAARGKIYVRLLLSIDRRETTAAAIETVELALEMKELGVVGIDLSGNPNVGDWITYLPALTFARNHGLAITLHCGEVPNHDEIQAMLGFHPERIGHACCLQEDEWEMLKESKIPVEICLTSNILTATVASLDVHHFADLYNSKHPLVLCTDDMGVFSTSLCGEYVRTVSAFGLGKSDMFLLARSAVDFIFADDGVKTELNAIFDSAAIGFNP